MNFEMLEHKQVREEPFPKHRAKYRTKTGKVRESVISLAPGASLEAAIERSIKTHEWLDGPKGPPIDFPLFCRLNSHTGLSEAELRKDFKRRMEANGKYSVDKNMEVHRVEPA